MPGLLQIIIILTVLTAGALMPQVNQLKLESTSNPVETPYWAKTVVWYQIFPERFFNGDPTNDPTLADIQGTHPWNGKKPWKIHPWTSDWYELQDYERVNGKGFWHNVFRRRYGGDLQGVLDKLDYLQDLGVTAIYLNPIFDSPSLHKYDAASYHHVDPNLGPDPEGDRQKMAGEIFHDPSTWVWTAADQLFLKLLREIHRRKMYVIIDGVFNHMGYNSPAFQDVLRRQQQSPYKSWFKIESFRDPQRGTRFKYRSWAGVKELPELRQDENGIVKGPREYIYAITRRWMDPDGDGDPSDGVDGWRLDVAYCIAHPFWKDWRKFVKSINPQAYLTGEVIEPVKKLKSYLQGDEFDALMNYQFAFIASEFFVSEKKRTTARQFDKRLRKLWQAFPEEISYVMQNLYDSHDSNRLASHIVNRDLGSYRNWANYFHISKASNPDYQVRKPTPEERQIQKLMVIFQMTYPGAPMIYYGDECGMWGANDPDCRKPMIWPDMEYAPEVYLPDGSRRPRPDTVEFNWELFRHYRKLIRIRNTLPALQLGNFRSFLDPEKPQVYAFQRDYRGQRVVVVLNNEPGSISYHIPVLRGRQWQDVLNEEQVDGRAAAQVVVPGKWGRILVQQGSKAD